MTDNDQKYPRLPREPKAILHGFLVAFLLGLFLGFLFGFVIGPYR